MKKLILFLLIFCLLAATFSSCGGGEGGDENPSPETPEVPDDPVEPESPVEPETPEEPEEILPTLIFDKDNIPAVIYKKGEVSFVFDEAKSAQSRFNSSTSLSTSIFSDDTSVHAHEIVMGDTSREISKTAKAVLEGKLESITPELTEKGFDEGDISGYLIYSDGASVAIVWTDFRIAGVALDYFTENYAKESELLLAKGFCKSEFLSLSGYLKEREETIHKEKWAALEGAIPEEYREDIIREMKNLYSLYDDKAVDWLASLYDPETGGFYNSLSARNTEGYGPDIENTYYAIVILGGSGMAEMYGGRWREAFPADLMLKAATWIKSLQAPDGYFYHPQWPKEYIEKNGYEGRITRDKGSANTILEAAGLPTEYTGSAPSSYNLTGRLGGDLPHLVSKVVTTSSLLDHYRDIESFRAYLSEFEDSLATKSDSQRASAFYSFGGLFQTTTGLMSAEMKDALIEFLNKHQNPENGMWSEGLYYDSTNAFHKIASVYNKLGRELQYKEKVVDSVLAILKWDVNTKPVGATVELYNVWSCISYLYTNIRGSSVGTAAEKEAKCKSIAERVMAGVSDAIAVSYAQMVDFLCEDGSFSYGRYYSASSLAGCPAAVPYTKEGDISGFIIATFDIPHYILASLDLYDDYNVPLYTEEDRARYINGIRSATPPEKVSSQVSSAVIYDFESSPVDGAPIGVNVVLDSGKEANEGSYIKVALDGENKVLEFNATARKDANGRNYSAFANGNNVVEYPTVSILEFKLKVNSASKNSSITSIIINSSETKKTVMQATFKLDANGNVIFYETSGTAVGKVGVIGDYIDFRMEYEPALGEYRIYSGGVYVGKGTSTYNGAPHSLLGAFVFNSASTVSANYYIDDLSLRNDNLK